MGGGGDGGVSQRLAADEQKREGLRSRVNAFYGMGPGQLNRNDPKYQRPVQTMVEGEGGPYSVNTSTFDEEAYNRDLAAENATAAAAREQLGKEENELSGATRGYYADQLRRGYERAERQNRFNLADRGLLRGSADIDTQEELNRANTEGSTRVEDQVRDAVTALKQQREQERMNAVQLIQQGVGEDAVQAASAGRERAFANTQARQQADITSDLFQIGVQPYILANDPTQLGARRFQQSLSFFRQPSGSRGVQISGD